MYKNIIIESINDTAIKENIYNLLASNTIRYTKNLRDIPNTNNNLTENDIYKIVINPTEKQLEYTDKDILTIDSIRNDIIKYKDKLINAYANNKKLYNNMLQTLKRKLDAQYNIIDIEKYISVVIAGN